MADELWLSLGFPLLADSGAVDYSEADAEALRSVEGLIGLGLVDETRMLSMTRVMGQSMARLASAQVELFGSDLLRLVGEQGEGMELDEIDDDQRAVITELLVPGVEKFLGYVWRRHLMAAVMRLVAEDDQLPVVGFVDLVDFTRTTRKLDDNDLAALVTRWERHVYETVTNSGARLRKLLGDGVMFDAPDATMAATAALNLVMRCAEDPHLEGARGGLAIGRTLEKDGDVYGATVNRASRLADLAYPNTVVVDAEVGATLRGQPGFEVRALGHRSIKGLGRVDVAVIRSSLS